jgi:undecaprenyl-phosphate 4-deoxy-4-formamido-L-arabinose transferase
VRENRQDTWFRKLASRLINHLIQHTTGKGMGDYGCMLRAYRRRIVDAMLNCSERSTFIPILANTFARNTVEIPVAHAERQFGESKYNIFKLFNLMFDLLTCLTTTPLRLLSAFGVLTAVAGFVLACLLVVLRLVFGPEWAAEGVFTLFAILFMFIGAQFVGVGILGEYIGRIYIDVRARPRYFVQQVIGAAMPEKTQEDN